MPQKKAREVRIGEKILDRSGIEIIVTNTWDDQGPGLGVCIIGDAVSAPSRSSFNRYLNPDELVEVVGRKED